MAASLSVFTRNGRIGLILREGKGLRASSRGLQDMADAALRKAGGDAGKAYQALTGFCNGYLTIIETPPGMPAPGGGHA